MRKQRKVIYSLISLLCLISILSFSATEISAENKSYSWYCKRTADHSQPRADAELSFIEKYDGYYIDKRNDGKKMIYLTFDVGYENGNVARVLDTLKSEQVSGAFFILSNLVIKNPEIVMRMHDEGHLVCNHTSKHKPATSFETQESFAEELGKLENLYTELVGEAMPKFFRPPEGRFSEQSMQFASSLGYKTIFWSFAYADWDDNNQPSQESAIKTIMDNVHPGAVLLLHPTSSTNADILKEVITLLRAEGYTFGTLQTLTA